MSETDDPVQAFEAGLSRIGEDAGASFSAAENEHALRAARARLTGPNGELTTLLKLMPRLPGDRRKAFGQRANELKQRIESGFEEQLGALARAARAKDLASPPIDVTLPGRATLPGKPHPIRATVDELLDVFASLGFEIGESREVELSDYNFGKLAFPPDHPATDMQDSFFVRPAHETFRELTVLRTHTTSIQVHELLARTPPLAVVAAGAVYRRDEEDATHSSMFHQIDGFLVDRGVTMAHLQGVLGAFVRRMFGSDVPVRFRPSYFPFVEPGGELDMGCTFCRPWQDAGSPAQRARTAACRVCKSTGWMEILGCGMIHPEVFEKCGHDPAKWSGFAWGMGVDRMVMLRHGIRDIRLLFENEMRFLTQL
jgi:phenylalanyl-tRNA synthetase alpha chain